MKHPVSKIILLKNGRQTRIIPADEGGKAVLEWTSFARRSKWRWELRGDEIRIEEGAVPPIAKVDGRRKGGARR